LIVEVGIGTAGEALKPKRVTPWRKGLKDRRNSADDGAMGSGTSREEQA